MHNTSSRRTGLQPALLLGAALLLAGGCGPHPEESPPPGQPAPAPAPGPGAAPGAEPASTPPPPSAAASKAAPVPADSGRARPDSGKKLAPEQLQSLVAPIALFPDDLLSQTLVASTYPLEIIQLQQWLAKHPNLKDQALADSVAKQPWDPSIQSMAALPDLVKRLSDDIQWTTDLGNAFLAQESDLMDAVQVMRQKAKEKGALESNDKQKVSTKQVGPNDSTTQGAQADSTKQQVAQTDSTKQQGAQTDSTKHQGETKQVIVVESANPEVVYVPSYNPTAVWGAPVYPYYPYPSVYYPAYTPGAAFMSFSIGFAWGAAAWGGSCCHYGWGGNTMVVNNYNRYNRVNTANVNRAGGVNRAGTWQHNPQHRGGTPYSNQAVANRYGGGARGAGADNRAAGVGQGQRGAGAGVGERNAGAGQVGGGAGAGNRPGGVPGTTPPDRIGNQSIQRDAGSRAGGNSGFSGGSQGFNGSGARASSARGGASMGGMRGGGGGRRR